ncbi:hypothetical protein GCM10027059_25240 [Myceligenerans halotolerans]
MTTKDLTFERTTVCGLDALVAPGDGELRAGLVFRVGTADETWATSGITHLLAHVALYDAGAPHDVMDVGATTTGFLFSGTPGEVVTAMNDVVRRLREIPHDRAPVVLPLIAAETASNGPLAAARAERYGSRTHGLVEEAGLGQMDPARVEAWARGRFTRDNAVLWVAGEVPDGLDLSLPDGNRVPPPEPESALRESPAWFRLPGRHVIWDAVVSRTPALGVFAAVAQEALYRDLRVEGGWTYDAGVVDGPRDASTSHMTLYADAHPEKVEVVTGAFCEVVGRLRAHGVAVEDLERARARLLRSLDEAPGEHVLLGTHAVDLLLGRELRDLGRRRAEIRAVTAEAVDAVARQVWETGLLGVPGEGRGWAGLPETPQVSGHAVAGQRFDRLDLDATLVIGEEGVSMLLPEGPVTVRYDDCVMLTVYPDGGRRLAGGDGFAVPVEPVLHDGLWPGTVERIDASVSPEVIVHAPARHEPPVRPDPARIKQVKEARQQREVSQLLPVDGTRAGHETASKELSRRGTYALLVLILTLGGLLLCLGALVASILVKTGVLTGGAWLIPAWIVPAAAVVVGTILGLRMAEADKDGAP